jgi:hypothetical protein
LTRLIQSTEDSGLQTLQDHAVGTLHPTIGLWVCYGRPIDADVELVTELQELSARELGPVVTP